MRKKLYFFKKKEFKYLAKYVSLELKWFIGVAVNND